MLISKGVKVCQIFTEIVLIEKNLTLSKLRFPQFKKD